MKGSTLAIAAAFVVVAAAAFFIGRSGRAPQAPLPTPETGGRVDGSPAGPAGTAAPSTPGHAAGTRAGAPTSASPGPARPGRPASRRQPLTATPELPRVEAQTYANAELGITLEKPRGTAWVLADKPQDFRSPAAPPGKVIEIRRVPQDGGAFALIEMFVVDIPAGGSEARLAQRIVRREGLTDWSKTGRFAVVEEGPADIGGRTMTRRVTRLEFGGNTSTLFSLRTVRGGKLHLLVAMMQADGFDSLRPEIERAFATLKLD